METQFTEIPSLTVCIAPDTIGMFTTLLQAGIVIPTAHGNSIGAFLEALPGFTPEYITDQVQTIFLNGTATDDMETPLEGTNPVLAISAAMPGLAGAIFRKNSLHAALRTTKKFEKHPDSDRQIVVTLKLFNTIARDRGAELLRQGVTINAANFTQFLDTRTTLPALITAVNLNDREIPRTEIFTALSLFDTVHLTLVN